MARKPPPPPARTRPTGEATSGVRLTTIRNTKRATLSAMLLYFKHPGMSLRNVWEHGRIDEKDEASPMIRDWIAWNTIEKRATEEHWPARRNEHWDSIEKRVLSRLQTSAVEAELEEIAELEVLKEHAKEQAFITPAKTMEGALNAIVQIDQRISKKRERIQAIGSDVQKGPAAITGRGSDEQTPMIEDGLSDQEIEEIAIQLASKRAGLIPAREGGDENEGEGE